MLTAMSSRQPLNRRPEPSSTPEAAGAPEQGSDGKVQGVFGVGLDNDGGHHRITKGDEFYLVGGSAETHERMQDLVIRMTEKLKSQGKKVRDLSRPEFEDLARDSLE
jgi:hypothetical protein